VRCPVPVTIVGVDPYIGAVGLGSKKENDVTQVSSSPVGPARGYCRYPGGVRATNVRSPLVRKIVRPEGYSVCSSKDFF
jgi:hypothetical protein